MSRQISNWVEVVERQWCRAFHGEPMWPVNGQYRCRECLRTYPVAWSNSRPEAEAGMPERKAPQAIPFAAPVPAPAPVAPAGTLPRAA
jgi:hypothetical protein